VTIAELEMNSEHVVGNVESGARKLQNSREKRWLDIVGSAIGILFLLPLFILVAIAICVESRGPVFFRQRRTGYGGSVFVIYKFRTMRVVEDGPEVSHALRHDHRVTRLGYLLRRSSVDELPQLFNVLKGDMSLVGPRPHAIAHDEFYGSEIDSYSRRFLAKPGITGLAQVTGFRGHVADINEMVGRVDKDLIYIRAWSFWLDIKILAKTVLICLFSSDAF
jgi:putative colanic acid biosynthesis UDP-glucose lipid carrier transferase